MRYYRNVPDAGATADEVGDRGWSVEDLLLPSMTLRRSALEHNVDLFARWCAANHVSHAPHAKTHQSPELARMQLAAGAWGMTAATVSQARYLTSVGAQTILLAHEVADRPGLGWLAAMRQSRPDVEVMTLVDSAELVERMVEVLRVHDVRDFPVLLELGRTGGRTGARSWEQALAVADAVRSCKVLRLVGVEAFEGVVSPGRDSRTLSEVDALLRAQLTLTRALDRQGVFDDEPEIIFTAGGSSFPDRVAQAGRELTDLARPARTVVRAGAYLTHEHASAAGFSPLAPEAGHPLGALRPALELWSTVVSTPEPDLAIAAFGKRDAPYDIALPTVLGYRREGHTERSGSALTVEALNDQHAFIRHGGELRVGDVLRCGVAHPCTAFDKWPLIPVLDDDDKVVDAITTHF